MPVRKLGLCYRSVGGRVPMGPDHPAVTTESTLERDFALLQRFDPEVVRLEEQPVRIVYRDQIGQQCSYVPDFLVSYRNPLRPADLVEIKYSTDTALLAGDLDERFAAARDYACERGWQFAVKTEIDIRTPYLTNVTFLSPFRYRSVDATHRSALLEMVRARNFVSVDELAVGTGCGLGIDSHAVLSNLWSLIAQGELRADLQAPLTMRSLIRSPREVTS